MHHYMNMSPEPNEFHDKDRTHHHSTPHHFKTAHHGYTATIIPGNSPQYPTGPVPRYGTVIPNRVFVGGIEFKTEEEDLHNYFRHFGAVKDTKIIRDKDHSSKGYGFVTFEDPDDAERVRQQESFILNGKKLNIGPAVRKQPPFYKDGVQTGMAPPGAVPTGIQVGGSWVWHPSAGGYASWTNQNGITYFSPVPNPMITSLPQHQQIIPHGTPTVMATYNTSAGNPTAPGYPSMAPHTAPPSGQYAASYPTGPCGNQVAYGTVHVPTFSPPIAGACGQIIAPTATGHANVDQINMVPVPSQNPHPGYIVPRSIHPTPAPQAVRLQVLPASTTPPSTYNASSTAVTVGGPHYHQHPSTMVAAAPAPAPQYNIVTLQQQQPHDPDQSFHSQPTEADLSQSVGDITFNEH